MIRRRRISGLCVALFCLLAPGAQAAAPLGKAALVSCDRAAREAVFEGRVTAYRKLRMQMRFTLQASTPDEPKWRAIDAPGFGEWISAPAGVVRYTYDKTVQELFAPAGYRAVLNFRWRDARGRTIRAERAVSPVCRQPDSRPDLVLRSVRPDPAGYVAVVVNRGKRAAGPFDVSFLRDGMVVGSASVFGLAPGQAVDVFLPGPRCTPGERLEALVDPGAAVDEANEENDALAVTC